jgi:hypothetical protein
MTTKIREIYQYRALGLITLLVIATILLGLGFAFATLNFELPFSQSEIVAFSLLLAAILFPFIPAIIRKKIDIFQPVYVIGLITFVYFILVPLALGYQSSGYLYYGIDYRNMLVRAELIALIALLGFYSGYYLGQRYINPSGTVFSEAYNKRVTIITIIFGGIATILMFTWILVGKFPLWALNIFDKRASYGTWFDLTKTSVGYLYSARLAFIPLLITGLAFRKYKYPGIYWVFAYIIVGVMYLIMGIRIVPMTLFLATIIYIYLEKQRRPNILVITVVALIFFVFNGFIATARGTNQDMLVSIENSWKAFLEGNSLIYGLSMLSMVFPDLIPFQHGRILLSDLLVPIPRLLWAQKPVNTLFERIDYLIPIEYSPPVYGSWYADFGLVGPFIVMMLVGFGCAYVYKNWKRNPSDPYSRVLLSVTLASLPMIYSRINVVVFNWIFWVILPVILIRILAGYRILPDQIIADNVSTINGVK